MSYSDSGSFAIVGCGAMGSAIGRGLVASGFLRATNLWLCDADGEKVQSLSQELHCQKAEGPKKSTTTLFCVKPQVLPVVAREWSDECAGELVISIAAGVSLTTLETLFPKSRVIRVMPNIAVSVGKGASAVCKGNGAKQDDLAFAMELFGTLGAVAAMNESQLDVAGALSGCGPAYLALFVDALTLPAIEAGLSASTAREFLLSTFAGSSIMLQDGEHPRAFMERVMSPGGTTVKAISAMEPLLTESAKRGVEAALEQTRLLAEEDA